MASPREARGWFLYALAVGVAFLVLAFRLYYSGGSTSPFLIVAFLDVPLLIAVLAGALAAVALSQALWFELVKPHGPVLYVASLLMFVVGVLHFYALPNHLARREIFLLQFLGAFVVLLYTPTLSWRSKPFVAGGIAGAGALLAASAYGTLNKSMSLESLLTFQNLLLVATLAAEGVLILTLLRLGQISFGSKAVPA